MSYSSNKLTDAQLTEENRKFVDSRVAREKRMEDDYIDQIRAKDKKFLDAVLEANQINRDFKTLDSGKREDFATGARRDTQDGKPRYELIPPEWLRELALAIPQWPDARVDLLPIVPMMRLASLYGRGAKKYGEGNYQKGIPFTRVIASLLRHVYSWLIGERSIQKHDEDHLAAVAWNSFALMFYEEQISKDLLPQNLNDIRKVTV